MRCTRRFGSRPLLGVALAPIALAAAVSACGSHPIRAATTTRTAEHGTRLACPTTSLHMSMGPPVVPYTGEQAIAVNLTNVGRQSCLLIGYPAVVVRAGGRALPFTYDDGGGPYLTTALPKLLTLRPRDHAEFVVAKYRCDAGELRAATSMQVWIPGVGGSWEISLARPYIGWISLCRKFKANGPPDPGNTINVSPLTTSNSRP
jgi:hypothetical protein